MESAPGGPPRPSHAARTPTVTDHIKYGFAWRDHRQWPASSAAALNHPGMQMCWSTWALRPRPRYLCCINLSRGPHLTVVSRGERGQAALPAEGYSRRLHPGRYGGAAVSIGDVKTITVQRLSVRRCDPTILRSDVLCGALERFHCDPYPPPHQPCFRTHRGAFKDELEVSLSRAIAGADVLIHNASLTRCAKPCRAPDYYTICCCDNNRIKR